MEMSINNIFEQFDYSIQANFAPLYTEFTIVHELMLVLGKKKQKCNFQEQANEQQQILKTQISNDTWGDMNPIKFKPF